MIDSRYPLHDHQNGIITYIANFKNNAFKSQTKIVDGKKATGHKVVVDQGKKATCTEDGSLTIF